ncbi:hypothetical protein GGU11DRAFT_765879 [Lentinula aff. detonsa]|nr:hypothetical protein GGU11DRAFT_765879 [Lentinula aff. detonsa]
MRGLCLFLLPLTTLRRSSWMSCHISNFSPPAVPFVSIGQLENAVTHLLDLYSDIPAPGSPFNTENNTFGLSPGYKRISALLGDLTFQSQRRLWIQTASNAGVKTFSYLFTQPQLTSPAFVGVSHGSEIAFVYGTPPNATASAIALSTAMIDY